MTVYTGETNTVVLMPEQVRRTVMLYEMFQMNEDSVGRFSKFLFKAIQEADSTNIKRLFNSYPYEVYAHLRYVHGDDRFDYIKKEYKIDATIAWIDFEANEYLRVVNIPNLKRDIANARNSMLVDKQTVGIAQLLVSSGHGVYIPQQFGKMIGNEELSERDPYSEGYWDWWTHTVQPAIDKELNEIISLYMIDKRYPNATFTIDYEEHSGDLAMMVMLPEDYWNENEE
jgi:hypothetical protein